jgi:hypothetical protein
LSNRRCKLWANSKLRKNENTAKARGPVKDAALMGLSFDVTIYIYAGTVLGRQPRNSDLKNMSSEVERWTR